MPLRINHLQLTFIDDLVARPSQLIYTYCTIFILGIKIRFLGEARTKWVETEKRQNQEGKTEEERKDVEGHEEYFQISYYLLGGANSGETELPPGAHTYPFTCSLPPQLPSSFEGEFGFVRYTIKVTLDVRMLRCYRQLHFL